jgi:hypothetical protein
MAVAVAATEEVAEAEATAAGPGAVMAGAVVDAAGAGATILVRCLLEAGKRSLAAEWAHGVVSAGVAATGAAAIGIIIIIIMM